MALSTTVIDGQCINLAPLETLDLNLLKQNEPTETQRLLKAAQWPGFFYIRLDDYGDGKYLRDLQTLYSAGKKYFSQPDSGKMADYREDQERGYKPGKAETLEISRDESLTNSQGFPKILANEVALMSSFVASSHDITKVLLDSLSSVLKDPQLQLFHLDNQPSASGLKLESVPMEAELEDVPFSEHTDMGTLTLLFCEHYTTELCMPGTQQWRFIEPRKWCAIVNVGDSLQRMTHGGLRSCLHRVGQPVKGKAERVCVLYYLRPSEV